MSFTFRDVLGSFDLTLLAEAMAERRVVHRGGASMVRPSAMFSLEELEILILCDGIARKDFRVTVNGHALDLEQTKVVKDGRLQPLALRQWARKGASIILNDIHRYDQRFAALAQDAERVLHDRVAIAAIASLSKLPALPAHYDPQDLIIVQIEGSKTWRFFGASADCGVAVHPRVAVPKDISSTVSMKPGDILFVPAGLHHQCEADEFSLHIGIVIKHATILDFLGELFREYPSLNRPLRAFLGMQSVSELAGSLKDDLISRFSGGDVAEWLADWNGSRAAVTSLGLRNDTAADEDGRIASLAVTMTPAMRPGDRWKVGGVDFAPSAGARAVASILDGGSRPVKELLRIAAEAVGAEEARNGLDQLVNQGLVYFQ